MSSPHISPIIISPFHQSLYDITTSSYTSIVESFCHPSLLDGINNITPCPIITGNHILPHHYGESHHAPSLWASCIIILGLINRFNLLVRPWLYIKVPDGGFKRASHANRTPWFKQVQTHQPPMMMDFPNPTIEVSCTRINP
jgi:hypothetical protein